MTGKFAPVYSENDRFARAASVSRGGAKMTDRCVSIYPWSFSATRAGTRWFSSILARSAARNTPTAPIPP